MDVFHRQSSTMVLIFGVGLTQDTVQRNFFTKNKLTILENLLCEFWQRVSTVATVTKVGNA